MLFGLEMVVLLIYRGITSGCDLLVVVGRIFEELVVLDYVGGVWMS